MFNWYQLHHTNQPIQLQNKHTNRDIPCSTVPINNKKPTVQPRPSRQTMRTSTVEKKMIKKLHLARCRVAALVANPSKSALHSAAQTFTSTSRPTSTCRSFCLFFFPQTRVKSLSVHESSGAAGCDLRDSFPLSFSSAVWFLLFIFLVFLGPLGILTALVQSSVPCLVPILSRLTSAASFPQALPGPWTHRTQLDLFTASSDLLLGAFPSVFAPRHR
ncbi:hypothetical protein V8C35DRAFT_171343 [Trichoderma chlorosporum]